MEGKSWVAAADQQNTDADSYGLLTEKLLRIYCLLTAYVMTARQAVDCPLSKCEMSHFISAMSAQNHCPKRRM